MGAKRKSESALHVARSDSIEIIDGDGTVILQEVHDKKTGLACTVPCLTAMVELVSSDVQEPEKPAKRMPPHRSNSMMNSVILCLL